MTTVDPLPGASAHPDHGWPRLRAARTWWIAVALVVTACSTPSAPPDDSARAPTPNTTATARPTAEHSTPTPTATVEPSPAAVGGWHRLANEPTPHLHDLVIGDDGFVGVGLSSDPRDPAPALWRSADGRRWTEEPYELEGTTREPEILYTVVEAEGRLMAIGSPVDGIAESADGRVWTHPPLGEGACPSDLAVRGDTAVAVGGIGPCQMGGLGDPGAWSASAGGAWTGSTFTTGGGFLHGVVATVAGVAAWGTVADEVDSWVCQIGCFPDPSREPFAGAPWFSADGVAWKRVADPAPFALATIEGMATADVATLAVGWVTSADDPQTSEIAAWISPDGQSWTTLDADLPFATVEQGRGLGIGGGASGFAVWSHGIPGVTTMVWTSRDGRSWDAGTELPIGTLRGVAPLGDGLIAFGTLEEADPGVSVPCNKDDVVEGRCRTAPAVWVLDRVP